MGVPDGVQTVTSEGKDLKTAVASAAGELGLSPSDVGYKVDLSHFRSAVGGSVARTTVRIVAWEIPESERKAAPEPAPKVVEPAPEAAEPAPRASEPAPETNGKGEAPTAPVKAAEDAPREERPPKPDQLRGAETTATEASDFAAAWFSALLGHMDIEGQVTGTGSDDRVHLSVKADNAGRIVGKRGATLGAIRHLLGLALVKKFGHRTVDVDVNDDRPREPRRSNGRDRDRDRDRDRGGPSRGRRERSAHSEDKLRALARRAAEKAMESGKTITINLELNSFDRRLVHLEVSEIEGVRSLSDEREGEGGRTVKYIQIIPATD